MSSLSLSKKRRNRENNGSTQNDIEGPAKKRIFNIHKTPRNASQSSFLLSSSQPIEDSRRCGKIISMHLINFMCHSNLLIDFQSRVNFLVGRNGSGKSAVLAALVLGLGCNAKVTNRSRSAKEFIKVGEKAAKIEIVISNNGSQPYERDVYGDNITIVRNITSTSGNYVIKNTRGSTISRKFDDLQSILLYHNVQVDNPVFVLNQESAREFLKDLEPSKNYKLFLKATQLDLVTEKLNECLYLHRAHMEELKNEKKKLEQIDRDIKELTVKLEELVSFDKLEYLLKNTEIEYSWLLVQEYEDKLQDLNNKLNHYNQEKRVLEALVNDKEPGYIYLNRQIQDQHTLIDNKNTEYQNANDQLRQIRARYDQCSSLCLNNVNEQDSLKSKRVRLKSQIAEIEQYIEQKSRNNQDDVQSVRRQNESKVAAYREECETNLMPIIKSLKHDLETFIENKSQKEMIIEKIKQDKTKHSNNILLLTDQIQSMKKDSNEEKSVIYGEQMPRLLDVIRQAYLQHKFTKMPLGPFGSYIEVPNSKYRDVVETVIGPRLLKAFLVHNTKDRHALESIFTEQCMNRPTIITTSFIERVHDVRNGSVSPTEETRLLMNEIRCTHPMVMNYLIDRIQIETILLTHGKDIAENITSIRTNVPRNLSKVIVFNEECTQGMEYHPKPYRMYSLRVNRAKLIQVNINEHVKHLEAEKSSSQRELRLLNIDLEQMSAQLPKDTKHIEEKRSLLKKTRNEFHELQQKIADLENFEYADNNNSEVKILKKEMEEINSHLANIEMKLSDLKKKLIEGQSEKKRLEDELEQQQNSLQLIQNDIESVKTQLYQLKLKLRSINDNSLLHQAKMQDLKNKKKQLQVTKDEVLAALNSARSAAEKKGDRPQSISMSADEIRTKIAKIKAQLQRGKPTNLDPDSLRHLIGTKKSNRETSGKIYEDLEITIKSLRQSLMHRFDFIGKFKRHMSLLIEMQFSCILELRNFSGKMCFDHKNKTLKVSITPRDHNKNAVSSTRALSGGERSYSTVAFLLALWSVVDHPFYFLDEYDVFTDEVNREYMTRLLIDEGRKRPLRQYTFLTPQDMTLAAENFIKIHRLKGPNRH